MARNANRQPEATALLKKDHAALKKLLSQLKATTTRALKKRQELLAEIAQEIRIHARIEEEIFYPAFHAKAQSEEDDKKYFEAKEEHGLVDVALPKLEDADPASEIFGARAKVLYDLIDHHAEEEETEMFPRARKLLGSERLVELGEQMLQRKHELTGDFELVPRRSKNHSRSKGGRRGERPFAPSSQRR